MTTTAPTRTRAEIEREIAGKRRERLLYVTAEVRAVIDDAVDELVAEWIEAG